MAKNFYAGNPEFPIEEPQYIVTSTSTNDTDIIYCIDTIGVEATFGAGMKKEDGTASAWASKAFTGVLYGRFTNVTADVTLACYRLVPVGSES